MLVAYLPPSLRSALRTAVFVRGGRVRRLIVFSQGGLLRGCWLSPVLVEVRCGACLGSCRWCFSDVGLRFVAFSRKTVRSDLNIPAVFTRVSPRPLFVWSGVVFLPQFSACLIYLSPQLSSFPSLVTPYVLCVSVLPWSVSLSDWLFGSCFESDWFCEKSVRCLLSRF
ncbi:hypothetical protein EUTSA_v10005035mg [Eutrema salsugineum]|uniref:Uncharacterized protein n=1 Tax=Eutrema salsugineum TaxID=72664 RepID=V4KPJ3_EUTSA|nr:hypothetical protein EUTSA_v10005035mg [Eutrema salsugineum]